MHKGKILTVSHFDFDPSQNELYKHIVFFNESTTGEHLSNVEGIPLTDEWLIKFGFVKKGDWWYRGKLMLGYITKDECFQFEVNGDLPVIDLPFVHQLQNLYFALTGEELVYNEKHFDNNL